MTAASGILDATLNKFLQSDLAPVFIVEHHSNEVRYINGHRERCGYLGGFAQYRRAFHLSSHCILPSTFQVYIWKGLQRDNHFTLLRHQYRTYRSEMEAAGYVIRQASDTNAIVSEREVVEYSATSPCHMSESVGLVFNLGGVESDNTLLSHFHQINFEFYRRTLADRNLLKGVIKTERSVDRFDFGFAMLNQTDDATTVGFNLPEMTKCLDALPGSRDDRTLTHECVDSMVALSSLHVELLRIAKWAPSHQNEKRNKMFAQRLVQKKGSNEAQQLSNLFEGMSVGLSNHSRIVNGVSQTVTLCNHYDQFNDARDGYDSNITALSFLPVGGEVHRVAVNGYNKHGCGLAFEKSNNAEGLLQFLLQAKATTMKDRWDFHPSMLQFSDCSEYKAIPAIADKSLTYSFYVGTVIDLTNFIQGNLYVLLEIIYCMFINTSPVGWREGILLVVEKGDPKKTVVENFCELLCASPEKSASGGRWQRFTTSAGKSCSLSQIYLSLYNLKLICERHHQYESLEALIGAITSSVYDGGVKLAGDLHAHQTVAILCRLGVLTKNEFRNEANFCEGNGTTRFLSREWGFDTAPKRKGLMRFLEVNTGMPSEILENGMCLIGVDSKFQEGMTNKSTKTDVVYRGMRFYPYDESGNRLKEIDQNGRVKVLKPFVWHTKVESLSPRIVKWWGGTDLILREVNAQEMLIFSLRTKDYQPDKKVAKLKIQQPAYKIDWSTKLSKPTQYAPGRLIQLKRKRKKGRQKKEEATFHHETVRELYGLSDGSEEFDPCEKIDTGCHLLAQSFLQDGFQVKVPGNKALCLAGHHDVDVFEFVTREMGLDNITETCASYPQENGQPGWSVALSATLQGGSGVAADSAEGDFMLPVNYHSRHASGRHLYNSKKSAKEAAMMKMLCTNNPEKISKLIPERGQIPGILIRKRQRGGQHPWLLIMNDSGFVIGFDYCMLDELNSKHGGCVPSSVVGITEGLMSKLCPFVDIPSCPAEEGKQKRNRGRKNTSLKAYRSKKKKREKERNNT